MGDTTASVTPEAAPNNSATGGSNSGPTPTATEEFTPITSQEELERRLGKRLERERAKFADYEDAKAKAARFDELERANKSEAEKAAERLERAERKAAEAEARATRREIALEHRLSADDAALLDGMTDEAAMRKLAERLAAKAAEQEDPVGFRVDHSGRKPGATPNKDDAARAVFGI